MVKQMTADDILPLVAGLTPQERARLIRLIAEQPHRPEGSIYEVVPPGRNEFSSDGEPLAWEGEGWEEIA